MPNTHGVKTTKNPIKPFVYHHFHNYLASLLSCKDLKFMMDNSCNVLMAVINDKPPDFVRDIWDAEFMRSFKGPHSHRLLDRDSKGQYLFSLNVDFFNVEAMHIKGASTSCELISGVCLNLLPEIQYKPENMYVGGIILGPNELPLTQTRHQSFL